MPCVCGVIDLAKPFLFLGLANHALYVSTLEIRRFSHIPFLVKSFKLLTSTSCIPILCCLSRPKSHFCLFSMRLSSFLQQTSLTSLNPLKIFNSKDSSSRRTCSFFGLTQWTSTPAISRRYRNSPSLSKTLDPLGNASQLRSFVHTSFLF